VARTVSVLVLGLVLLACNGVDEADCMWPGRPECEPVGTTLVVEDSFPDDPLCGQRRYYDEKGEAAFSEMWCA
jgi:hypothetical protein